VRAHDDIGPIARRPLFTAEHELAGAWTTWGLVLAAPPGATTPWERVCEEALTDVLDAWRWGDGTVWLVGRGGVARGIDGGCSTETLWDDDDLSAVVGTTDDDEIVWLLGAEGVWRSAGGATPAPCAATPGGLRDLDLGDDGTVWATGTSDDGPWIAHSTDTCESWTVGSPPEADLLVVALHGATRHGMLAALWRVDGSAALVALHPGETQWLAELPQAPEGAACLDEFCLLAFNNTLLQSIDLAQSPSTPTDIEGPARCLWLHDDAIWGCAGPDELHHLAWTKDGTTWTDELLRGAVAERSCTVGEPGADACVDPFADTGTKARDTGPAPALTLDEGSGCGCRHGAPNVPGAAVLLVWAVARRRRARAGIGDARP